MPTLKAFYLFLRPESEYKTSPCWQRNYKKLGPSFHRHTVDSYLGHIELSKNAKCRLFLKNIDIYSDITFTHYANYSIYDKTVTCSTRHTAEMDSAHKNHIETTHLVLFLKNAYHVVF